MDVYTGPETRKNYIFGKIKAQAQAQVQLHPSFQLLLIIFFRFCLRAGIAAPGRVYGVKQRNLQRILS